MHSEMRGHFFFHSAPGYSLPHKMPSSSLGDLRSTVRAAPRPPVVVDVVLAPAAPAYERLVSLIACLMLVGAGIGVGFWVSAGA